MTEAFFLCLLVLLLAVFDGQSHETCAVPGWFGPDCVFKCHCQNDTHEKTHCHQTTGKCAEGSRCEDGYTGTACQYSDLAFGRSTSFQSGCQGNQHSSVAVDSKDDTCFTANATRQGGCSWSVNLFKASFVTQIRLKVPPDTLDADTWQVLCHNDMNKAKAEATRQVSNESGSALTFFPLQNFLVSRVEVIAPSGRELKLCEVNVVGGRNMGLKKTATQGEGTLNISSGPEKAVEEEGKRYYNGQCAIAKRPHDPGQPLTWWKVFLGPHVVAWQAEIHTSPEQGPSIAVTMRLSNGSLAELTNKNEPRAGMVMVTTDWPLQATELIITQRQRGDHLKLCEVRVVGDCLDGYFGWSCAHRCNCSKSDEVCDKVWGTCWGSRCPGDWREPWCQKVCPRGFYGPQCREKCSPYCVDGDCLQENGACTCEPGRTGDNCSQTCPPGSYGSGCREECSVHCVDTDCLSTSGTCTKGCYPGWEGQRCVQTCGSGFYGNSCGHKCSATCLDGLCDPVSGSCTNGCVVGLQGHYCRENVTEGAAEDTAESFPVLLVVGGAIVVLGTTVGLIVTLLRRRSSRRRMLEMESQLTDEMEAHTPLSEGEQEDVTHSSRGHVVPTQTLSSRALHTRSESAQRMSTPCLHEVTVVSASLRPSHAAATTGDGTGGQENNSELGELPKTAAESSSPDLSDADLSSTTSPGYIEADCENFRSNVVAAEDFPGKVARWLENPELFRQERSALPEGKKTLSKAALLPQNILKNRYRDVYLYDHSRVILDTLPGDPCSDFYNACYIDGYNREKEYIAAQGPVEKTVDDFLRMVWDVRSPCVVMLTNTMEMGRVKCHQYWPAEGGSFSTGNITVTLLRTTSLPDFAIRDLILQRGGKTKRVKMLHYTAWPADSTPSSPWSLLDFRSKVRQTASAEGPTIVHCSAGIGRTGAFLALDILLALAEREKTVDVFTCVWNLRQQRPGMVQTLTQYMFIYEAVAAALGTSAPVAVEDFDVLRWFRTEGRQNLIEKEYRSLKMCVSPPGKRDSTVYGNLCDLDPVSWTELSRGAQRVSVFAVDNNFSPVFVNAVFLPSYRHERAFVQTHSPQDGGVVHFLSVVCQHHVSKIVCLDTTPNQKGAGSAIYWPDKGRSSVTFEPYRVELLSVRKEQEITTRTLRIHLPQLYDPVNDLKEDAGSTQARSWHDVTQCSCSTWPDPLLTSSWTFSDLKTLMKLGQPTAQGPVLVHCRDGRTRSGFFCVLSAILERMRVNGDVAISYVTAHMSVSGGSMIISQEQFECLFHIIKSELDDRRGNTVSGSMCL